MTGGVQNQCKFQVRAALEAGEMERVTRFLGRAYTLLLDLQLMTNPQSNLNFCSTDCFLNQPPGNGSYQVKIDGAVGLAEFVDGGVFCSLFGAAAMDRRHVRIVFV